MAAKNNNLEGYSTNPTTISSGNSGGGSGDAFDGVNIDSTETLEATTAQAAHGSWSMHAGTSATSGQSYAQWFSGVSGTTLYGRVYVRTAAAPSSNTNIVRFLVGTGTIIFTARLNSTGKVAFLYSSGTLGGTSSASFPTGQWFRLEYKVVASTTAGSVDLKCFLGADPDASSPTETLSVSGVNTGSNSSMDRNRIGIISSVASTDIYFDDMNWNDSGFPGPATAAQDATVQAIYISGITAILPAAPSGGTGASVQATPTDGKTESMPAAVSGTTGASTQAAPIAGITAINPATPSGSAVVQAAPISGITNTTPVSVSTGSNGVVQAVPIAGITATRASTFSADANVQATPVYSKTESRFITIVGGTAGVAQAIAPSSYTMANPAVVSGTTGAATGFKGWGIPVKG